jgi:hypothetical protein
MDDHMWNKIVLLVVKLSYKNDNMVSGCLDLIVRAVQAGECVVGHIVVEFEDIEVVGRMEVDNSVGLAAYGVVDIVVGKAC